LEPDYFIDRPPAPTYIPNPEGDDRQVQVHDKDDDLFDFELEAEPILEVLVGKALEHARMEVIEEFEEQQLKAHKKRFA
jgi:radial spoke head protein 3